MKVAISLVLMAALSVIIVHTFMSRSRKDENCRHHLQEAIDQYTADRKAAPRSMQDLIDAGYKANPGEHCFVFFVSSPRN
jgi:hypothetical protein